MIKPLVAVGVSLCAFTSVLSAAQDEDLDAKLDSLKETVPLIEKKVLSSLKFGGSSPVSFSGEARIKGQYHNLAVDKHPGYMADDRSYLQTNWEGNESLIRLGMTARPGRNVAVWARLGFQTTLPGLRDDLEDDGEDEVQVPHDKTKAMLNIHETMNVGIAIRSKPASFWLKMGNVQWIEGSPLTIWKGQPRMFAWEYLPYEVEQPTARFYEYAMAKGQKTGRAAWNKKPFNGINFESISLPADLYVNFFYGMFERYDNFELEYIDLAANDLGLGSMDAPLKSSGLGDSYRTMFFGRIAKKFNNLTMGLNFDMVNYSDDIKNAAKWASSEDGGIDYNLFNQTFHLTTRDSMGYFAYDSIDTDDDGDNDSIRLNNKGKGFFKEPKNFSLDLKGNINEKIKMHSDIGINWIDTTYLYADTSSGNLQEEPMVIQKKEEKRSTPAFGLYSEWDFDVKIPLKAEVAYFSPDFYAPFSFVAPVDAFYAFGSNMVGPAKFIGRGEGSPYVKNMAGLQLTAEPELSGYGHLRVKAGAHFQVKEARDLLFFPYRLNGYDIFSFSHSTYARWGQMTIDHLSSEPYKSRLGDETIGKPQDYSGEKSSSSYGFGSGGLTSDYLGMYESFVPYRTAEEAKMNFKMNSHSSDHGAFLGFIDPIHTEGYATDMIVYDQAKVNGFLNTYKSKVAPYKDTIDMLKREMRNTSDSVLSNSLADSIESYQNSVRNIADNASLEDAGETVAKRVLSDTIFSENRFVPHTSKQTYNFQLDYGYDISDFIGYKNNMLMNVFYSYNNVIGDGDILLQGHYLRFEPSIALTDKFYMLGIAGIEKWISEYGWKAVSTDSYVDKYLGVKGYATDYSGDDDWTDKKSASVMMVKSEIDYTDLALGFGFDWGMLDRVGLHGRIKWIKHIDKEMEDNNFVTPVMSAEMKMWF